ncbi:MAG: allantoin permease [Candidatus Melainabacteria bacterium]|nr:MAG: allantoin permease [Candidatus Melainabacteria bacterium]
MDIPGAGTAQQYETGWRIEKRSIDYVPLTDRHGRVLYQGPFWFLGNLNFFTLAIGFIGPGMGLGFAPTCLASILGILFGTLFMAIHASQGPELGLPQMIQSRAQFGYRGVIVPLIGTLFTFGAFNVVDTALVSQGLSQLYGWSSLAIAISLTIAAIILSAYGHDWLHYVFRLLFWISLPAYLILSFAIIFGKVLPTHSSPTSDDGWWVAFAAQFAACASYNITFAPYVSDYTRYLPRNTSRASLILSVYLGASLSAIWLIVLGAWLAANLGVSDGMVALNNAGDVVVKGFGGFLVAISVVALAAAMALNAYSGMLTIITGIDTFHKIKTSSEIRVVCIIIFGVLWLVAALMLSSDAIAALYNALTIMLYLLIPWSAVNLVDYFIIRRGNYAIIDLFKANGIYGEWSWRGLLSYFIGLACSVPFFNIPGVYEGLIAKSLGGVDIAWVVALSISGATYYLFTRGAILDETAAIQASRQVLDGC